MKKLFAIISVCALLMAGCATKAPAETEMQPQATVDVDIPNGAGEAVVPEEGDISIEIG